MVHNVKAELGISCPIIKTVGAECKYGHCTSFNGPKSHFSPQCETTPNVCCSLHQHHRNSLSWLSPFKLPASRADLPLLPGYELWKTAGPLHFCINLHLSQTVVTLTSLWLVTSVITTITTRIYLFIRLLLPCSFCRPRVRSALCTTTHHLFRKNNTVKN